MKTKPMSLASIQGKLSRAEMKQIMAGSGGGCDQYQCLPGDTFVSCATGNPASCGVCNCTGSSAPPIYTVGCTYCGA